MKKHKKMQKQIRTYMKKNLHSSDEDLLSDPYLDDLSYHMYDMVKTAQECLSESDYVAMCLFAWRTCLK